MECGKLTAKLRDAVPVIFIEEGREPKRFKNIEIPDEIKTIEFKDFKFDVPASGQITFKIYFEPGTLPAEWSEARARKHRPKEAPQETMTGTMEETTDHTAPTALAPVSDVPAPIEQEPTVPEVDPESEDSNIMVIDYGVSGDRRKEMVAAIGEHLNIKPEYMALPTYAYRIGEYEVSRIGVMTGPNNPQLIKMLKGKGFEAAE